MHGQYMINKEISVQYAYKKDGKGERHGDEAERMLAKQAKAHGVTPATAPLPAHLFQALPIAPSSAPNGPQVMMNGDGRGIPGAPHGPTGGYGGPPGGGGRPPPASLPPPPSGLPARPPSGAMYGGPPGFGAPGSGPPGFARR